MSARTAQFNESNSSPRKMNAWKETVEETVTHHFLRFSVITDVNFDFPLQMYVFKLMPLTGYIVSINSGASEREPLALWLEF